MRVTVLDWNVNGWHTITDQQIALIKSFSPDVVTLQEVTPRSFEKLMTSDLGPGTIARDFLPPGHRGAMKGSRVRFWAALFVRPEWGLQNARVLEEAPSPERSVMARVLAPRPFVAASFAVPPGVIWFERKREQGDLIARWLKSRRMPVVAGMDRNGPKSEAEDGSVTPWPHDSMELVDPGRARYVRDVHTIDGLAATYRRGRRRPTSCRYDAIYASHHFAVKSVHHVYDDAIAAGSDHGLVAAELELTS